MFARVLFVFLKVKVWGKCENKTCTEFSHKKRDTRLNVLRREERTKKEEEKKFINSKNAPSALERHRSQI